ncbi:hypothetical protein SDC9_103406 [bioreactor metagenome]|uniref:Uncharacterized protein n=1 Tax=bioreactor metagenome TaxID=1076179 RepID=A0A645AU26_9ZZZZ
MRGVDTRKQEFIAHALLRRDEDGLEVAVRGGVIGVFYNLLPVLSLHNADIVPAGIEVIGGEARLRNFKDGSGVADGVAGLLQGVPCRKLELILRLALLQVKPGEVDKGVGACHDKPQKGYRNNDLN